MSDILSSEFTAREQLYYLSLGRLYRAFLVQRGYPDLPENLQSEDAILLLGKEISQMLEKLETENLPSIRKLVPQISDELLAIYESIPDAVEKLGINAEEMDMNGFLPEQRLVFVAFSTHQFNQDKGGSTLDLLTEAENLLIAWGKRVVLPQNPQLQQLFISNDRNPLILALMRYIPRWQRIVEGLVGLEFEVDGNRFRILRYGHISGQKGRNKAAAICQVIANNSRPDAPSVDTLRAFPVLELEKVLSRRLDEDV